MFCDQVDDFSDLFRVPKRLVPQKGDFDVLSVWVLRSDGTLENMCLLLG